MSRQKAHLFGWENSQGIMFIVLLVIVLLQYDGKYVLGDQCSCPSSLGSSTAGYSSVSYSKMDDDENVVNPGRGFYRMASVLTSNFHPLSSSALNSSFNVVLRLYYLDTYIDSDLDSSFISKIKADLKTVQDNGWTVLLRFAYTEQYHGDARLSQILQHIRYLDSHRVFTDYGPVIAAIQAGFIGAWGEWYYTNSDFGIPGSCSSTFDLTSSQWSAREQVLQALLDASPKTVDIQVRVPFFKYHIWGKTATTLDTDRQETKASRIGYHNDAFLSGPGNQGTFVCSDDTTFMEHDSKYTVVAGETNEHTHSEYYACSKAKSELTKYHYSILHASYDPQVIAYWQNPHHECFNEIAAKLGYRLYLTNAILPDTAKSGGQFCYKISLHNNGYAAPYKPLEVRIVLQNTGDGSQHAIKIPNVDERTWQPGTNIYLTGSGTIPTNLHGTFKTFLVVAHEEMPTNSKYYVLLANKHGVQHTTSRMNDLLHTVAISSGTCSGSGSGTGTTSPNCHSLQLSDGSFENGAHGWEKLSNGFSVVSDSSAKDGHSVIRVTDGAAKQTIDFSSSPVKEFRISGYSRHSSGAHVSDKADYSIYCDLVHDHSETYGQTSNFDASSAPNVWHFTELHVLVSKPIIEANCYAMFRNGNGQADFDKFGINTCSEQQCEYQTTDASFEIGDGWTAFKGGFTRTNNHGLAENGNYFITVTNGGATQYIDFDSGKVTRFTLSGYSRAHSVSGISDGSDYSVYCDLTHPDHTNTWGEHANFDPTNSHWQKAVLQVTSTKVISGARCYAMFRNGHGKADFDNFKLEYCA